MHRPRYIPPERGLSKRQGHNLLSSPREVRAKALGAPRAAFSLIELLVVLAVLATILSLLLPALSRSMGMARQFKCQVSLRSIGFDFGVFADDTLHGDRGADERLSPRFKLETFQESQYGLDEFWRWGEMNNTYTFPDADQNDPMRCAEIDGFVTLRRGVPCRNNAITPTENVSYTFNGRLDRAPRGSSNRWMQVTLTPMSASEPMVPLAWDVDGRLAAKRGVSPVFSAPGLDATTGPFANDALWFPSFRHNGATNVLLTDQSVKSSTDPLGESSWRWDYLPR